MSISKETAVAMRLLTTALVQSGSNRSVERAAQVNALHDLIVCILVDHENELVEAGGALCDILDNSSFGVCTHRMRCAIDARKTQEQLRDEALERNAKRRRESERRLAEPRSGSQYRVALAYGSMIEIHPLWKDEDQSRLACEVGPLLRNRREFKVEWRANRTAGGSEQDAIESRDERKVGRDD